MGLNSNVYGQVNVRIVICGYKVRERINVHNCAYVNMNNTGYCDK
jgi:hypothetical protein